MSTLDKVNATNNFVHGFFLSKQGKTETDSSAEKKVGRFFIKLYWY